MRKYLHPILERFWQKNVNKLIKTYILTSISPSSLLQLSWFLWSPVYFSKYVTIWIFSFIESVYLQGFNIVLVYSWNMLCQAAISSKASITNITLEWLLTLMTWTTAICLFKSSFWANLASQMEHLNGFFPSCTVAKCLFSSPFWPNIASQMEH